MSKIACFEDLIAWQKSRELSTTIFRMIKSDRFSKNYALKDQLCRAVISVSANIAEGYERDGNKEFIKHLSIAKGSVGEVRSLLYMAVDLECISLKQMDEIKSLSLETARLIGGLISYIQRSNMKGKKFRTAEEMND